MSFGFASLYLRYKDEVEAAGALAGALKTEEWLEERFRHKHEASYN